jgi:hypothetical protein
MTKRAQYQILAISPSKHGGFKVRLQHLAKASRAASVFISSDMMRSLGLLVGEFYSLSLTKAPSPKHPQITAAQLLVLPSYLLVRWIRHTQFLTNGENTSRVISKYLSKGNLSLATLFNGIHRKSFAELSAIPANLCSTLIAAWHNRTNAISITSYLAGVEIYATLWIPLSNLYGRLAVSKLKADPLTLTPFICRDDLHRFFSRAGIEISHEQTEAINLIYTLADQLHSGTSLVDTQGITDEQLLGLPYCVRRSIVVQHENNIQLNSANLIETAIRHRLSSFKRSSIHKFSAQEIEDAIDRASSFYRTIISKNEKMSLLYGANLQISCVHSDRANGDSRLEKTASLMHELLFGETSTIITCGNVHTTSGLDDHAQIPAHIDKAIHPSFVMAAEPHQYIVLNSNHLSIDKLYKLLKRLSPSTKIVFIGPDDHVQVSAWGYPYWRLFEFYSSFATWISRLPNSLFKSLSELAEHNIVSLWGNTPLDDICKHCITTNTFPLIATIQSTITAANNRIHSSLKQGRQPILETENGTFYANERIVSRRSVIESDIMKNTPALLISCTDQYVLLKISSQYRKISLVNFLQAEFALGYCVPLDMLGGDSVEQAIAYAEDAYTITPLWINTLVWTSQKPPVIAYPTLKVNSVMWAAEPLMQKITPYE